MKFSLWIYSGVSSGIYSEKHLIPDGDFWMLVRIWLLATLCLDLFL